MRGSKLPHLHVQDIARFEAVGLGRPLAAEGRQARVGLVQKGLAPTGTGKVHLQVVESKEDPQRASTFGHCGTPAQEEAGRVD